MDEDATLDRQNVAPDRCPSHGELSAFNRGRLPAERMESVAVHLGICRTCEAALRALSDESDLLIASLRSSHTQQIDFVHEPGCQRLEARARAVFPGGGDGRSGPPKQLGPYLLLRRVRGGGMGDVYEATHTRLGRRVALKTLRADRMHDPRLIARFTREMSAVGQVNHAHVVRASDAGEVDGWHFLVMDYVDGLDLAAVGRLCGPMQAADAAEIVRQTALGLQSIHEHGFVHRDLKPSNLMLDREGQVKILDLGLALLYEGRAPGDDLTETGLGLGTADYMSPEQALDSHDVNIQSDLYSLGCTLYKLLTGRAPFDTSIYRTPLKKMKAHIEVPPPPVQSYLPEISAELAGIVHRLLEKAPARRFATPHELALALEPYAVGSDLPGLIDRARKLDPDTPAPLTPPPVRQSGPYPGSSRRARQRRAMWGTALGLAGFLLVVVLVLRPWDLSWMDALHPRMPGMHEPNPQANDGAIPPVKDGRAAQIQWPDDFPAALRERPPGKRIALVERGKPREGPRKPHQGIVKGEVGIKGQPFLPFQPLWSRRLAGTGLYFEQGLALTLNSCQVGADGAFTGFTALALDDDRALRWFELDAELWPAWDPPPFPRAGVFFGWRPAEKEGHIGAYFVYLLDRVGAGDDALPGWLFVNYLTFPADSLEASRNDAALDALEVNPLARVPLTELSKRYTIHVRATEAGTSVSVNRGNPVPFKTPCETRGALGIWVQRGHAWFDNVSITALSAPVLPP